tara:strand:+ start:485 stop:691 length:207 start_codon:yes stop_codon:yes gene_type:complete
LDLININTNMVTLQLNENQADVLLGLIDIATKSGGLNVAEAAVFFSKAIGQQLQEQQEQEPNSAEAAE